MPAHSFRCESGAMGLMTSTLGIPLALACALAANIAFLFKHRSACSAPAVDMRSPLRTARRRIGSAREHDGSGLGAAAGTRFGVSDIAIRESTALIGSAGISGLFSPWTLFCLVASVAGFYASAKGLQDGDAVGVIAVTGTTAN